MRCEVLEEDDYGVSFTYDEACDEDVLFVPEIDASPIQDSLLKVRRAGQSSVAASFLLHGYSDGGWPA